MDYIFWIVSRVGGVKELITTQASEGCRRKVHSVPSRMGPKSWFGQTPPAPPRTPATWQHLKLGVWEPA